MIASADSQKIHWITGDSENNLKINIFLAAVESAVDVDADTDPAQGSTWNKMLCDDMTYVKLNRFLGKIYLMKN